MDLRSKNKNNLLSLRNRSIQKRKTQKCLILENRLLNKSEHYVVEIIEENSEIQESLIENRSEINQLIECLEVIENNSSDNFIEDNILINTSHNITENVLKVNKPTVCELGPNANSTFSNSNIIIHQVPDCSSIDNGAHDTVNTVDTIYETKIDNVHKKQVRGPGLGYKVHRTMDCLASATKYVEELNFTKIDTKYPKGGTQFSYRCKDVKRNVSKEDACTKKIKIFVNAYDKSVVIYESIADHRHKPHALAKPKISKRTKEIIDDFVLKNNKKQKLDYVRSIVQTDVSEATTNQVKRYYRSKIQEKFGNYSTNYQSIIEECSKKHFDEAIQDQNFNENTDFIFDYEVSEDYINDLRILITSKQLLQNAVEATHFCIDSTYNVSFFLYSLSRVGNYLISTYIFEISTFF